MTGRESKVLIAGAGIGGLTAAVALLRRSFDEAFEQAPDPKEIRTGVQIAANGSRVLRWRGSPAASRGAVSCR